MKILSLYILKEVEQSNLGLKMIRTLKPGTYYNFYKDIHIEEEKIVVPNSKCPSLYSFSRDEIELYNNIAINICAIVGENGSGKSSIIDMIIRIINNLATYTLGESINSDRLEHLHYIENVYAKMFVQIESRVLGIKCCNTYISVEDYWLVCKNENNYIYAIEREKVGTLTKEGYVDFDRICSPHNDWKQILENFCQTIVNNYSLHSFNPWTYVDEFTSEKKEKSIIEEKLSKAPKKIDDKTDCCWLKGLFRRDANYQIPLIVTPTRLFWNIDMENENKLSRERFASLLLMESQKYKKTNGMTFKEINKKLEILAIKLSKEKDFLNRKLSILKLENNKSLMQFIKEETEQAFSLKNIQKDYKEEILYYINIETLNVICTYNYFDANRIITKLKGNLTENEKNILKKTLDLIWNNHSYITINLMRCINYLRYDHIGKQRKLFIEAFRNKIESIVEDEKKKPVDLQRYPPQNILELLPPPIFSIDFLMYEALDKRKLHAIPFSTLSSGEKQMTYIMSSLFYHLHNIDSEWYGKNAEKDISIKYKHVNIIFDEVELYFHPEMQRSFISNLLSGLKQLSFENIESIQILIVTHSPFVLSDIPNDQILFLQKNGQPATENAISTFGANFHSMLKHSFFLKEGTIGKFAQEVIKDAIRRINFYDMYQNIQGMNEREKEYYLKWKFSILNDFPNEWKKMLEIGTEVEEAVGILDEDYIRQILSIIQEPVIKARISDVLNLLR